MSVKAIMMVHKNVSFLSHVIDSQFKMDFSMITSFFGALEQMASSVYGSNIESIDLGEFQFSAMNVPLNENERFYIIAIQEKSKSDKKLTSLLENLRDSFLKLYDTKEIIGWDGNILHFFPFKRIINKIVAGVENPSDLIQEELEIRKISGINENKIEFTIALITRDNQILDRRSNIDNLGLFEPIIPKITLNLLNTESKTWEGIVPLLSQHKIAFIHATKITDQQIIESLRLHDPPILLILYCVNENAQLIFTRLIPVVKNKIQMILPKSSDVPTPTSTIDSNTLIQSLENELAGISPDQFIHSKISSELDFSDFSRMKGCDQLIHGLLIGSKIAITGRDPQKVKKSLSQALLFTPHRSLHIMEDLTSDVLPSDVDIVTISPDNVKKFKDFIIVDIDRMQVKNGESNDYCEKIQQELKILKDADLAIRYIRRKVNWLISKAALIRNLSWEGIQIDSKEVQAIRGDLSPDAEKIVLHLASGENSILQNLLDFLIHHIPAPKLKLSEDFVIFNAQKVLVNARLNSDQIEEYYKRLMKLGGMMLGPRVMESYLSRLYYL